MKVGTKTKAAVRRTGQQAKKNVRSLPGWVGMFLMAGGVVMAIPEHPIIPEWVEVVELTVRELGSGFQAQYVFIAGFGVTFYRSAKAFIIGGK